MDASSPQVFATPRAARRAAAGQALAIELPIISRVVASAAAEQVKDKGARGHRKPEEWQAEAYQHAMEIGELGYVLTILATAVARGRLVAVETDEHGDVIEPEKDEDGRDVLTPDRSKAERVLQAFRGPEGDHKAMLAAGALHDQIAGEAILVGEPVPKSKGISWEVVSVFEIIADREGKLSRKRSGSMTGQISLADKTEAVTPLDPEAYTSRYHRRDWMHSGDPTSTLRRNATVCRQIIRWDQLIDTTIMSRLNAGVLLVPEEVTFPADDDQVEDGSTDVDRFMESLVEHLSAPVTDRKSAASLAPMVVRCASELIKEWRLLSLTDDALDLGSILDARERSLRRLAAGLDVPLEEMEGMGSTNHWSSANISQNTVEKHVIPLGERLARFFTVSFYRRMLIAKEGMDEATAERWSLGFDGSEIESRMDAAVSADTLHKEGLISDDARIEAHGFDPNQVRPSEEERLRRQVEKLGMVPDKTNRVILPAAGITLEALVEAGVDPEAAEKWLSGASAAPAPPAFGPPQQPEDEPVEDGPPMMDEEMPGGPAEPASGEPGAEEMRVIVERIRTLAAATLDRALLVSANQVVTAARKLPSETRSRVDSPNYRSGPRKAEVLRLLGPADWRAIQRTPEGLLRGAFDELNNLVVSWLREHYEGSRDALTADEDARRAASVLCAQLDARALSAFREPLPREAGLSVPLSMVWDALSAPAVR